MKRTIIGWAIGISVLVLVLFVCVGLSYLLFASSAQSVDKVKADIGKTVFLPNAPDPLTTATISNGSTFGNVSAIINIPLPRGATNVSPPDIPNPGKSRLIIVRYIAANGLPATLIYSEPDITSGKRCDGEAGRVWETEHGYCINRVDHVTTSIKGEE